MDRVDEMAEAIRVRKDRISYKDLKVIELESLSFQQGPRLMSNKKCSLVKGSTREGKEGYEEVFVPAVRNQDLQKTKLIKLASLPDWAQKAFPASVTNLNRI